MNCHETSYERHVHSPYFSKCRQLSLVVVLSQIDLIILMAEFFTKILYLSFTKLSTQRICTNGSGLTNISFQLRVPAHLVTRSFSSVRKLTYIFNKMY